VGKIVVLDELTSNQIAAGEVVERPASVAKEMIENSLDAGATSVTVEIQNGGISYLKIADNGSGIAKDDMELAFERHATSKIHSANDLNSISSFGFRGEALASVASVAEVEVTSRQADNDVGNRLVIKGGKIIEQTEAASNKGTTMVVKNLFYNTPARYKFLKKDYTEAGYIEDVVSKMALIHSDIAFKYINSKKVIIQTNGDGNIINSIYSIYGKDIARNVITFEFEMDNIKVNGVAGNASTGRSNRTNQIFFVNGRYIKNKTMSTAVENAYQTIVPEGKFPFVVVNLEMSNELVDVNVHPAKTEVRFSDESTIYRAVYNAVRGAVLERDLVPEMEKEETELPKHDVKELFQSLPKVEIKSFAGSSLPNYSSMKSGTSYSSYSASKGNSNYSSGSANKSYPSFSSSKADSGLKDSYKPVSVPTTVMPLQEKREVYEPIKERNESIFNSEVIKVENTVKDYKIIGTVFSTYIILQQRDEFYIIDQHAAHERVMYERLVKKVREKQKNKQMLMIPEVIELKKNEFDLVAANLELFDKTGFELEEFGGNSYKVSAVPSEISTSDIKGIFFDLIDSLSRESGVVENDKVEYFIFTMACKAAVKANMNLDYREIEVLIDEMMKLANPFTCPHGRPTAIRMSKAELEKKFKRS